MIDRHCGLCGKPIAIGGPIQEVQLTKVQRVLIRCEACAEGQVPPDLPDRIVPSSRTKRMTPIRQLATRQDWKERQAKA